MTVHSYLSLKCEIRESSIHKLGVFAKEALKKGEVVAIFGGDILTVEETDGLPQALFEDFLQVYEGIYLGQRACSDLDAPFKINHGCSPNIGVKGQTLFVARRDISRGEEMLWDYETTELPEKSWGIVCHCGSFECRGLINGEAWKDPAFQKKNEGFFSWYLQEKINRYQKEQEETFIAASKRYRSLKQRKRSQENSCTEGEAFQL